MKTIKFTKTVQYESEGRNKGPVYAADSVHTLADGFADRWLNRGVAEIVLGQALPEPSDPAPVSTETPVQPDVPVSTETPVQPDVPLGRPRRVFVSADKGAR